MRGFFLCPESHHDNRIENAGMKSHRQRSAWSYIPSLYFIEGLPYILINSVSIYMFKSLGLSNSLIGLAGVLMLPWVLKMFWAPVVDIFRSKRTWVLFMQFLSGAAFLSLAIAIYFPVLITVVVVLLFIAAFLSATHDIAADGYYMLVLDHEKQAYFVGIRSTAYRIAMLAGGATATVAGLLEKSTNDVSLSWAVAYGAAGLLFFAAFIYHRFSLPISESDHSARREQRKSGPSFVLAFKSYFQQEKIIPVLLFILFYRLGEALLARMATPFLLDPATQGGLGFSTATASLMHDVLGLSGLILGGILAGWLISRYGLKRCIWPMAIALNLPNLGYLYMAIARPGLAVVYPLVIFEQFGYGVGFTAFIVFLIYFAKGPYKTSHYAISTGFMALGLMAPSMISGYLQEALGYVFFFALVALLTLPGFILLAFIPLGEIKN